MVGYAPDGDMPVIVFRTQAGRHIVMAANFGDAQGERTVAVAGRYLNMTLRPHSFNTFEI